jgi:large subunit ribosomal protein L22
MEYRAHLSYLRIAPRKVRLLAQALIGLRADDALVRLGVTTKRSVDPLAKLIKSAVANASKEERKAEDLTIRKIDVNEGPKLKRYRPRAFGRAAVILKRSSHVTVFLSDGQSAAAKPKAKPDAKEPKPKKASSSAKKTATAAKA